MAGVIVSPLKGSPMELDGEEEYRRVDGVPVTVLPWTPGKGWPHGPNEGSGMNFPLLWHPVSYFRWRIAVHRQGPYAPGFKEFRQRRRSEGD